MAKTAGRYLLALIGLLIVYRKLLKPLLEKLNRPSETHESMAHGTHHNMHEPGEDSMVELSAEAEAQAAAEHAYLNELENVRQMARDNPKIVANVVKTWINGNE